MKRWLFSGAIALLVFAGAGGQFLLARSRPGPSGAVRESFMAALGGLRTIAAEVVWFRADALQEEGRFGELTQLASMLTFLEPHEPEVWNYSAWNLAYNISVRMPRYEDRWPWVYRGIRLLRDEGLKWNPRNPAICRELATLFELKVGGINDAAGPLYREAWKGIVEDVARRGAWRELAMDEEEMRSMEREYGISDWTNPQASALYWAAHALPAAGPDDLPYLNETIRQARVLYSKKPRTLGDPPGPAPATTPASPDSKNQD